MGLRHMVFVRFAGRGRGPSRGHVVFVFFASAGAHTRTRTRTRTTANPHARGSTSQVHDDTGRYAARHVVARGWYRGPVVARHVGAGPRRARRHGYVSRATGNTTLYAGESWRITYNTYTYLYDIR